jgi:hypothetical protein
MYNDRQLYKEFMSVKRAMYKAAVDETLTDKVQGWLAERMFHGDPPRTPLSDPNASSLQEAFDVARDAYDDPTAEPLDVERLGRRAATPVVGEDYMVHDLAENLRAKGYGERLTKAFADQVRGEVGSVEEGTKEIAATGAMMPLVHSGVGGLLGALGLDTAFLARRGLDRHSMAEAYAKQLNEQSPNAPWWIRLLSKWDDRHYPESYDKVKVHW